jgi:hypothetical protein
MKESYESDTNTDCMEDRLANFEYFSALSLGASKL